jgi:hypothetical protein
MFADHGGDGRRKQSAAAEVGGLPEGHIILIVMMINIGGAPVSVSTLDLEVEVKEQTIFVLTV